MHATLFLYYLLVGALIWCFLERTGVVRASWAVIQHRHPFGRHMGLKFVLATVLTILTWPRYVPVLAQKARWKLKCGWNRVCRGFT